MVKSVLAAVGAGVVLIACSYDLTEAPGHNVADLPISELLINGQRSTARMAANESGRSLGFQYATLQQIRHEVIYFSYDHAQIPRFHMKNVAAPLLIAWIGPDHRVIAIDRMAPETCCYEPPTDIIAALELAPEHLLANRIRPGSRVHLTQPYAGDP